MSFASNQSQLANQLPISIELSNEPGQFMQDLILTLKRISEAVNTKEGALYNLTEVATFQQYYIEGNTLNFRGTYRTTYDMVNLNGGPIANGATVSFPSNITNLVNLMHMFGGATASNGRKLPLPYAGETSNNIAIFIDATGNVVLVNNYGFALTAATITAEYTKS